MASEYSARLRYYPADDGIWLECYQVNPDAVLKGYEQQHWDVCLDFDPSLEDVLTAWHEHVKEAHSAAGGTSVKPAT